MSLQKRITNIVEKIAEGMHEREEIIAVALLGALSNQNTFLYGPPGTAKSLISRRLSCAFDNPTYFEYLMNRFSTPEDLFGPVSIKSLKEDRYTRKTDKYLPQAEFAFLDEIWKSSPAILNTLLTLINEKVFKNGSDVEQSPIKALIAASNETPQKNQGLDALYDRFIIRLLVEPITFKNNFEALINSPPISSLTDLPAQLKISANEWKSWSKKINTISLSKETITTIHLIRKELSEQAEVLNIYVSDRRWQKAAQLLKASAFFNDRKETNHSDSLLLSHCLWTEIENRDQILDIVHKSIKDTGLISGINLAELDIEKDDLDKEINKELFHKSDVYDTVRIGSKKYFKSKITFNYSNNGYGYHRESPKVRTIYIPYSEMKSKNTFMPTDAKGNELKEYECTFDGQGTCNISCDELSHYYNDATFTPKIIFHKGDKKEDINFRLINSMKDSVTELRNKFNTVLDDCNERNINLRKQLESPFITSKLLDIPLEGVTKQLDDLELRIKDCERLEALCRD